METREPSGYVANTDQRWFLHLRRLAAERARAGAPLEEVNFWRPSNEEEFHAASPGEPFLLRLKAPHGAIGGFGYYARASRVPLSLAWEAFLEANGAATHADLRASILRIRRRLRGAKAVAEDPDPTITCLMISEPCFFEDAQWVAQPSDWSRYIVSGKAYSLVEGEGARIWEECRVRAFVGGPRAPAQGEAAEGVPEGARYGPPHLVCPRLGQGTFRIAVSDAYGWACAVTGEHSVPVLEAAHIRPYSEGGPHAVSNGLLLRADLHRLYDGGYVTVTPDLEFRVSPRLRDRWKNGRAYYPLDGQHVRVPEDPADRPDRDLLAGHARKVLSR